MAIKKIFGDQSVVLGILECFDSPRDLAMTIQTCRAINDAFRPYEHQITAKVCREYFLKNCPGLRFIFETSKTLSSAHKDAITALGGQNKTLTLVASILDKAYWMIWMFKSPCQTKRATFIIDSLWDMVVLTLRHIKTNRYGEGALAIETIYWVGCRFARSLAAFLDPTNKVDYDKLLSPSLRSPERFIDGIAEIIRGARRQKWKAMAIEELFSYRASGFGENRYPVRMWLGVWDDPLADRGGPLIPRRTLVPGSDYGYSDDVDDDHNDDRTPELMIGVLENMWKDPSVGKELLDEVSRRVENRGAIVSKHWRHAEATGIKGLCLSEERLGRKVCHHRKVRATCADPESYFGAGKFRPNFPCAEWED